MNEEELRKVAAAVEDVATDARKFIVVILTSGERFDRLDYVASPGFDVAYALAKVATEIEEKGGPSA